MKKITFLFSAFVLLLSSCTEVVEIELTTSEPKLVVEALITDNVEPFQVKLTLLAPYFDANNPGVSNAEVYISDNTGNVDTLYHTSNGIYQTIGNRQGVLGRTYSLLVLYNGTSFTANSTIPANKMMLDTITTIYNQQSAFIDEGYNVILNAQDNGATIDYYRFLFYKNDTLQTDPFKYFVTDDEQVQGNYIIAQVPFNYQTGDTARVEIQCLDLDYFTYLNAVATQTQNTGGPFDSPPSNPPSNISNGALGYFAAVSRNWKEIVLP